MGFFKKKKEPEEVECEVQERDDEEEPEYNAKTKKKKAVEEPEDEPEPQVVQQLVPIEFVIEQRLHEILGKVANLEKQVSELLKEVKE